MMNGAAVLNNVCGDNGLAFEALLEEMRLQAFRVYESVRTAQRNDDGDVALQMRHLRAAAWRAAELCEQITLLHTVANVDTIGHEVESIAF